MKRVLAAQGQKLVRAAKKFGENLVNLCGRSI
jgi:hypothetical protein